MFGHYGFRPNLIQLLLHCHLVVALCVASDVDGVAKYAVDMSNHFGKCWLPLHQEAVTQLWRTPCCVRVRSFSDMFNIFVVLSGLIILPKLFIPRFRVYGTTLCNLWLFPNCLPRDVWYRIGHFSKYVSVYSSEILLRRPKCVSIASALLSSGSSTRLYVFRLTRKTWDIGKEYVGLRYGHVYVSIC
jgi:hypothetical protein